MGENIIIELLKGKRLLKITPPKEKLLEKIIGLEEEIAAYKIGKLDDRHKQIIETCEDYLRTAKEFQKKMFSHPHLVWNLLHRVDEQIILLMPEHKLTARVIDVKIAFDLNIKEDRARQTWLGDRGKLVEAINNILKGKNIDQSRYVIKEALQYLDDIVDYGFWKLSMNVLTSIFSALFIAVLMVAYFIFYGTTLLPYAILGILGAYISNLLTKEDFLFVWGGPYFRYLLYNLMVRPIVGAFAAVFFFLVEKSKLLFSLNPIVKGEPVQVQSALINININENALQYVFIVLAIAVGFGGEKVLRSMLDKVLKRMEAKAEKTKDTKQETTKEENHESS